MQCRISLKRCESEKHTASGFGKKSATIDMHTTHLLFLLSALASDYEHSTRPSKKASGTTNRTNKKKQPKPKPFFCSQKTSTKPCRNSDQLTLSFQLNWNMLISIMKTSLLSLHSTSLGQRPLVRQISVHSHLPVHDPHVCTTANGNISAVNQRIFEDVLTLDFNSLSRGQHSYVSAARAKTEHWSSETDTCPVMCGTSKGSKGITTRVKIGPEYPHLPLFFVELFHVFLVESFLSQVDHL